MQKILQESAPIEMIKNITGIREVMGKIEADADIIFEHNVKYQVVDGKPEIMEIQSSDPELVIAKDQSAISPQISTNLSLNAEYRKVFKLLRFQTKIEADINFKMKSSIAVKLTYGVSEKEGLFVKQELVFSGIKGEYYSDIDVSTIHSSMSWNKEEKEKEEKPTPFTVIAPFTMNLGTIQLFNHN